MKKVQLLVSLLLAIVLPTTSTLLVGHAVPNRREPKGCSCQVIHFKLGHFSVMKKVQLLGSFFLTILCN